MKKGGKKILKKKLTQSLLSGISQDKYINEPLTIKEDLKKKKIKITHWNVNGLRAVLRKKSINEYLEKKDFDIICLSEIKMDRVSLQKEKIIENELWYNKYFQYYHFSTIRKGYSGVSIFSKIKPINKFFGIQFEKFDIEGRVLTLEFDEYYLINVYVPNSKPKLERLKERVGVFDLKFREYILNLKKKKNVIVLGDMNVAHKEIDLKEPKKNLKSNGFTIEERNSFDLYLNNGFVDRWRDLYPEKVQYSWWSYLSKKPRKTGNGWRIDYCLINQEAKHIIEDVIIREDIYGSDHCPVEINVDLSILHDENKNDKEINQDSKITPQNQKNEKTINSSKITSLTDKNIKNDIKK